MYAWGRSVCDSLAIDETKREARRVRAIGVRYRRRPLLLVVRFEVEAQSLQL